jgi:hypothetical protein
MASIYNVFGLTVRSNIPIPGLPLFERFCGEPDVIVHLGLSPRAETEGFSCFEELTYVSSYTDAAGNPALRIWKTADGVFLRLRYCDGVEFWLGRKGDAIWAVWPETLTLADAATYLLGPILGRLLRLRGVTCLHASAVALDECCLVFAGDEGTGKSTTAAAFAKRGHGVLSDDVVALAESEEGFRVTPAYPHLCLWPDSVKMLYGSPEVLPRFIPDWDKRRFPLGDHGTRFENRSLPIGAIYLLGDRHTDLSPYVEALPSQSALLALVADSFASTILDREMRACEFEVLGRLVATVPVRRIYPSRDPARLGELCRVICEDFATLGIPAIARP